MKFTPSKYQQEIFDFIQFGVGNAVINAKAGSGKTTTLVEGLNLIQTKDRALFVAFNKAIQEDLSVKLEGKPNVAVRTYHSLGFSILKENFGKYGFFSINEHKYTVFINRNINNLTESAKLLSKQDLRTYKNNLKQLVDFARFNLAQSADEITRLCEKYDIVPISDECEVVPIILEWGANKVDEIDFTDMVWLCVERGLETYDFKYDFIFIDEAQDSSIMQQELIKKCFKRGARFIAIGDEFQCINAFAGADQDAFKKFRQAPNTVILNLPISYRCPKKVIELALEILGGEIIEPADHAIDGEIRYDVSPYDPKDDDMVLCRNRAQLVKLYMQYTERNKKSYLKGRNIGDAFKKVIEETGQDFLSRDMMCDGVFPRLYKSLFEMIAREMELTGLEYEDVVNTQKVMDAIDTINALLVLAQGLTWKNDLINKIDMIFTDDACEGVCLTTIHKAKGLEANNVYILCNSLMPSRYATKKWEIEAEQNLIYVAVTRAKKTLNYISEEEFPANMNGYNENLLLELEYQRKRMDRALNIETQPLIASGKTTDEMVSEDARMIVNKQGLGTRVVDEKRRKKVGGNKFAKFMK